MFVEQKSSVEVLQTYGFLTAVNHINFLCLKRPVVMFHLGKENQKYLRIHQRSWPKDIRSMEWGNWTFLSCIQRWKFTIGQSPRHFILQPSCDSCDHFSYLGFMKKKKKKKKEKACDLRPFEAFITQKVQCSNLQLNLNQKLEISRRIPSHQ